MRTKTPLKQEPAKPSALLDAKTARSTGIDRSSLTLRGLDIGSGTSMTVSLDVAAMRGSSSSAINCFGSRLLGRVCQGGRGVGET